LSGPTSSGKTILAYYYAGVLEPIDFDTKFHRVIFCSPIKALSNERYQELRNAGFDTGIETGDIKINQEARILCVTQEIYLLKYCKLQNCRVIIDEIHYMFSERERTKAYMDSICSTSKKSNLLLLSATIKNPELFQQHLNSLTGRNFSLISWNNRPVPLEYDPKGISIGKIKNAIIFAFSITNINRLINLLKVERQSRKRKSKHYIKIIDFWNCEYFPEWGFGISKYHGNLLPKEKHCIEELYREGYIDTIVGTDSLALGVNLPAKYVVFSTLRKKINGGMKLLPNSLFLQLSGRAGRYGYHDKGVATYLKDAVKPEEFLDYRKKKLETMSVKCRCSVGDIVLGKEDVSTQLDKIRKYYYPQYKGQEYIVDDYIKQEGSRITQVIDDVNSVINKHSKLFSTLVKDFYIPELEIYENTNIIECCETCIENGGLDVRQFVKTLGSVKDYDFNLFEHSGKAIRNLLFLRRFVKEIVSKSELKVTNQEYIEDTINSVDHTVLNFDF
jgi:superfamily II RNA helicase